MLAWKFREPQKIFKKTCELCGETSDLQELGVRNYRLGLKKEVFVLRHYDVMCASCGFLFSRYVPEQRFLNDLYRQFYNPHFDLGDISPSYDIAFRLDTIESYLAPGCSILEIGALDGFMSNPLEHKGYIYSSVDPSTNNQEISGQNQFILGCCPNGQKYDAISSYYVLEHVSFLKLWLNELIALLKPYGLLIVEVPNLLTHPRASLSSLHFSHFTPFHLASLFEDAGLSILKLTPKKASRGYGMCCVARLERKPIKKTSHNINANRTDRLRQLVQEKYLIEINRRGDDRRHLEGIISDIIKDTKNIFQEIYLWPANGNATIIGEIIKSQYPHIKCNVIDDSPTREGLYQEDFSEGIIGPQSIVANDSPKAFMLCSDNWNNAIFQRMKTMKLDHNPIFDCSTGQRLA